jgi:hypothetical protein
MLGSPPFIIGCIFAGLLLCSYCLVAFSDPGIIYKANKPNSSSDGNPNDITDINSLSNLIEDGTGLNNENNTMNVAASEQDKQSMPQVHVPQQMECGSCEHMRPITSAQ